MAESLRNNIVSLMGEKACTKCKVVKQFSDFHKHSGVSLGVQNICKLCRESDYKNKYDPQQNHEKYEEKKKRQVVTPDFIICSKCSESKKYSKFLKAPHLVNGRETVCRDCKNLKNYKRYRSDEKYKKKVLKYSASRKRLDRYGVTEEMFAAIFTAQNGLCAICNIKLDNSIRKLKPFMDHCHAAGKPRGILCSCCNAGIGMLKDNEENLLNSIKYLAKYRTR